MLRRGSAYLRQRTSRSGFSWEEEEVRAIAYESEEEDDGDGFPGDHETGEDAYDSDERDAEDFYPPAFDEEAGYDEADIYDEEAPYAVDEEESEALDEASWDEGAEDDEQDDERALVPLHSRRLPVLREASVTMPIFISGRARMAPHGALGHTPLALRASRPRPFFMHAFALGAVMLSLLVTAFALAPLSFKQDMLTTFKSLAGSAAPPPESVPFHWYSVHYGDTVPGIAGHFGVQAGGILELNQMESMDQIYIGMHLKVPNSPTYGSNYHALLSIPLAPEITPAPPYGNWVIPEGFNSFPVWDYAGDPWAGAFGQCTWWAHHKRADEIVTNMGDAWNWVNAAHAQGLYVSTTPLPNSTAVFAPGVQGALSFGHVAHVEQILPGGWVLISEMNFFWNGGGFARVDYRYITAGPGVWFIA